MLEQVHIGEHRGAELDLSKRLPHPRVRNIHPRTRRNLLALSGEPRGRCMFFFAHLVTFSFRLEIVRKYPFKVNVYSLR